MEDPRIRFLWNDSAKNAPPNVSNIKEESIMVDILMCIAILGALSFGFGLVMGVMQLGYMIFLKVTGREEDEEL